MLFSSLKSSHLKGAIIIEQSRQTGIQRQETRSKSTSLPWPKAPTRKKKDKITAAFQSGAFSSFPPRSNCLFSSLVVLSLSFAGVAAVPAHVPTCSVREEMSSPSFDPMPTNKQPSAMVRPLSHVPSFGGHCYPGVLRPVPADDDSSPVSSGSILPPLVALQTSTYIWRRFGIERAGNTVLYCTDWRDSHLCRLANSPLHVLLDRGKFLIREMSFKSVNKFHCLLPEPSRHQDYIFQRVHLRPQTSGEFFGC